MEVNYVFFWADHPKIVQPNLHKFYLYQQFTDVVLECEDAKMKAHSVVLAAGSAYFEHVLLTGKRSVVVTGVAPNILAVILRFLYLGNASIEEKFVDELLSAAKRLQVVGLRNMTKEELQNCLQVDNEDELTGLINGEACVEEQAAGDSEWVVMDEGNFDEESAATAFLVEQLQSNANSLDDISGYGTDSILALGGDTGTSASIGGFDDISGELFIDSGNILVPGDGASESTSSATEMD